MIAQGASLVDIALETKNMFSDAWLGVHQAGVREQHASRDWIIELMAVCTRARIKYLA